MLPNDWASMWLILISAFSKPEAALSRFDDAGVATRKSATHFGNKETPMARIRLSGTRSNVV